MGRPVRAATTGGAPADGLRSPAATGTPTAPPPSSDMDARIDQLTQLAALRDQGVLSVDEFETQKAKILAG